MCVITDSVYSHEQVMYNNHQGQVDIDDNISFVETFPTTLEMMM